MSLRCFSQSGTRVSLCIPDLIRVRTRAIRSGVWFRALSRMERGQIDLTLRVVRSVRSFFLAKVLYSIMGKLFGAMESRVSRLTREVGMPLARKLSEIARSWGCKSADRWADDPGFMRFLAVNYMNSSGLFRV